MNEKKMNEQMDMDGCIVGLMNKHRYKDRMCRGNKNYYYYYFYYYYY